MYKWQEYYFNKRAYYYAYYLHKILATLYWRRVSCRRKKGLEKIKLSIKYILFKELIKDVIN